MEGSEEHEQRIKELAQDAEREERSLAKGTEELGEKIDERRRESERKRDESIEAAASAADERQSSSEGEQATDEDSGE